MKQALSLALILAASTMQAATLPAQKSYVVQLSWQAPVPNQDPVSGYNLYRVAFGSSSYSLINTGLVFATTFTDPTAAPGLSYQYYATSVDAESHESAPSNITTAIIPFVPFPPSLGTPTAQ